MENYSNNPVPKAVIAELNSAGFVVERMESHTDHRTFSESIRVTYYPAGLNDAAPRAGFTITTGVGLIGFGEYRALALKAALAEAKKMRDDGLWP